MAGLVLSVLFCIMFVRSCVSLFLRAAEPIRKMSARHNRGLIFGKVRFVAANEDL